MNQSLLRTSLPSVANVVVKTPKGSRNQFTVDESSGRPRLERYNFASIACPCDYGYIPKTLTEGGEPLAAMVFVLEPTFGGCLIEARVLGLYEALDAHGNRQPTLVGVPHRDPLFANMSDYLELPTKSLLEIEWYLRGMSPPTAHANPGNWSNRSAAIRELSESIERQLGA